jgi:hypothetical protein
MSAKECATLSEKQRIDVFRILDNYPIIDKQLIITEKLSEHYTSLFKFLLGELREHVRHNYYDVIRTLTTRLCSQRIRRQISVSNSSERWSSTDLQRTSR